MDYLKKILEALPEFLPVLAAIAVCTLALWLAHRFLVHPKLQVAQSEKLSRQLLMLALTAAAIVSIILTLPIDGEMKGQLVGLLGLILTAVIALSSTTFVANIMAGMMLRSVRSFRTGDFIRIGDEFGRVTERGLFHIEIQTEDRDLTTLPNMYLVSQPVTVVRASGTIISTTLSLGYGVSHAQVEPLLEEAAREAGLTDPFVQVTELGNYAVTYRVAGISDQVKHLLTTRSLLRREVLDNLHNAGIEIASPTIMDQRPLPEDAPIVPSENPKRKKRAPDATPEGVIFDKADKAEKVELLREEREKLLAKAKALEEEKPQPKERISALKKRAEELAKKLQSDEGQLED